MLDHVDHYGRHLAKTDLSQHVCTVFHLLDLEHKEEEVPLAVSIFVAVHINVSPELLGSLLVVIYGIS